MYRRICLHCRAAVSTQDDLVRAARAVFLNGTTQTHIYLVRWNDFIHLMRQQRKLGLALAVAGDGKEVGK